MSKEIVESNPMPIVGEPAHIEEPSDSNEIEIGIELGETWGKGGEFIDSDFSKTELKTAEVPDFDPIEIVDNLEKEMESLGVEMSVLPFFFPGDAGNRLSEKTVERLISVNDRIAMTMVDYPLFFSSKQVKKSKKYLKERYDEEIEKTMEINEKMVDLEDKDKELGKRVSETGPLAISGIAIPTGVGATLAVFLNIPFLVLPFVALGFIFFFFIAITGNMEKSKKNKVEVELVEQKDKRDYNRALKIEIVSSLDG